MKKSSKLFLISCIGFGLASLSYAGESTLTIENNAKGIKAEIAVDLLCALGKRSTSSLDENPILAGKPKMASWPVCRPVREESVPDHSKIYVKLIDEKTGDYYGTSIQMSQKSVAKPVSFNGKQFTISVTHVGDYSFQIYTTRKGARVESPSIGATQTYVRIDG